MNHNQTSLKYYAPSTLDLPSYIVIFTPFELGVAISFMVIGLGSNHMLLGIVGIVFFLMIKRAWITPAHLPTLTVACYHWLPFKGYKLPYSYLRQFRGNHGF